MKTGTRLATAGRPHGERRTIVNTPVWRASTILFDSVAELRAATRKPDDGLFYGRRGTPSQWSLAEALTELEPGAGGTLLYPSGVAAIAATLLALLSPGDELLMVDSAYEPTRALCGGLLRRMGIRTRFYDPGIGAGIAELIGPDTKLIFLESPGSLTFEVQDVPAIVGVARDKGLLTAIDNTWATPLLFPALSHGVDVSILACTKYVVGHSDAMMGSATATPALYPRLRQAATALGQSISPDDAFLALRGLRTLEVRLPRHEESALRVARWLAEQPQVARVLHPALPDCPGHALWVRDFAGASGLFSFMLRGGDEAARAALIDGLRHFGIGFSWGGFESLALPVDPQSLRTATSWQAEGPLVRLHIGLEDPDDLIEDLRLGLERFAAAVG
ncbi:cystathionine beta-lyase [Rhizorhabdus sp.]|uniref:cystathionine beta-lyase n=1 Tax=Rhizorhabdus sp. TaxID=1968843 RepID=UPI0025ED1964|nr:cystathionine beta-lyase [Rhizorhabdus sp.]